MTHARLLALALLALSVAPVSTALTGTPVAAPASTLSGAWKGKLDGFYGLDANFRVQGNSVVGVLRLGKIDFPFRGTWDAAKSLVTFKYTYAKEVQTVKALLKGSTLTGFNISPKGKQTAVSLARVTDAGAGTAGVKAGPYVMTGEVRDEKGNPIAGAEVFADHTAYYNVNAVGKSDNQGRYSIALAHRSGTWNAGAYLRGEAGGQPFEVRLKPDNDTPFDGSKGAVRNFTYKASTNATGKVYTYVAHSAVEVDYDSLEFTFTPDGPNAAGSTAPFTRKFVMGSGVPNISLGRYRVSATHILNGVKQRLLLGSRQQKGEASSVLAEFTDDSHSGQTLELFLNNP
ncbi:hypothetical protein [Deinococcus hopiensis]|uniref:Carboxypeptidase regulatory-like domain-containing protein n=1 Tax=Deinococcus hopiensis KR-140 TaxID=695939 RepID=A0A1W1VW81_9DEIO|nr:hypothetical protein [Deinococcus hopiensis]SMB97632.1 hypothetical protein SAMN00790413_06096 [Deinococcus hopiensis KR-140]